MPRRDQSEQRRRDLIPIVAGTFADLGYRRTTTAELAARCGVRENILYRLWPDKRAMFIASLDHVYDHSERTWAELLETRAGRSPADVLLDYEATHHGELGLYRILFAGLSETDDAEIAAAMRRVYGRFHRFATEQVAAHRGVEGAPVDAAKLAWGIVGLGTVANIGRELSLFSDAERADLVASIGRLLLDVGKL